MQQILALLIISFFLLRLILQKYKKQILRNEFLFWLFFWLLLACSIIFIKKIDSFVIGLGFSASGIDVLLYLGVAFLFYMFFKLRIRLEKIEKNITSLVEEIALKNKK